MSVMVQTRGEVGGGVVAHLQCPHCGHFSKSHAHQLSHLAASHPSCLDSVVVGRLGNILMYQSTAPLFHCSNCFYTSRDFNKLYKHIITKHCMDEVEGGGREGVDDGNDGGEKEQTGEEGREDEGKMKTGEVGEEEEKDGGKESLKRKRTSETEEEDGEGNEEDAAAPPRPESLLPDREGEENVLMFDGAIYRCLMCGWKNKMKVLGINHVVRRHDIPRAYAVQAVTHRHAQSSGAEDEDMAGLSAELLKEEMEAMARVIRFASNRFICLICGWKTKLRGFAVSHVVRSHDVAQPYTCKDCKLSFFLPSRLQQHVSEAHRPGRYACPFCCFRSHFLGGFRRHCSRCNARGEEGEGGAGGEEEGGEENEEEEEEEGMEERKETRAERKRRRTGRLMEEVEEQQEEEDDDE